MMLSDLLIRNVNRVRFALRDFIVAYDDGEPEMMLSVYYAAASALGEQKELFERVDARLAQPNQRE